MSDSSDESNRLGEQIERLSLANGRRRGGGISAVRGVAGHVFFGPYLSVPPGPYSVRMTFAADAYGRSDAGLTLEAAWGGDTIASVPLDDVAIELGLAAFQFVVPATAESDGAGAGDPKLEIRLFSKGSHEITVTSVDLRRMSQGLSALAERGARN